MYAFLNNFQGEGIKLERHPEKETETETETENERESISNEILTRERVEKWSIKEPESYLLSFTTTKEEKLWLKINNIQIN